MTAAGSPSTASNGNRRRWLDRHHRPQPVLRSRAGNQPGWRVNSGQPPPTRPLRLIAGHLARGGSRDGRRGHAGPTPCARALTPAAGTRAKRRGRAPCGRAWPGSRSFHRVPAGHAARRAATRCSQHDCRGEVTMTNDARYPRAPARCSRGAVRPSRRHRNPIGHSFSRSRREPQPRPGESPGPDPRDCCQDGEGGGRPGGYQPDRSAHNRMAAVPGPHVCRAAYPRGARQLRAGQPDHTPGHRSARAVHQRSGQWSPDSNHPLQRFCCLRRQRHARRDQRWTAGQHASCQTGSRSPSNRTASVEGHHTW